MMKTYKLICFDVDGTLVKSWSNELLPGVADYFAHLDQTKTRIAFVTNQGGVGLRYWMEQDGFGEPEKLPTEQAVYERLDSITARLGIKTTCCILASFAFQAKTGAWSPLPEGAGRQWAYSWRKPAPGMIKAAMVDHQIFKSVLMVGDSEEDEQAARAAGVDFIWADEFFGRAK